MAVKSAYISRKAAKGAGKNSGFTPEEELQAYRDMLLARAGHLEGELAKLKSAQAALESRVQLMRPESIDPDMLDELARRTLEYVGPDDLIIPGKP